MEKSFCFNSINGDRKYKAEDFREYFASFISNGIFPNPSTNLQAMGGNGNMTVTLKKGPGWINGALYVNDNDLILPVDVADGILNRIDRVVLRMDTLGRAINAIVKKGAFASSPVAPELQRDADAYEIGIADIYIAAGATQITHADITDLRLNSSLCGMVHGTVQQVDTTTLFNQYQTWLNQKKSQYDADMVSWTAQKKTDFNTWYNNITSASQTEIDNMEAQFQSCWNNWFATVQSALDGDTAGNLFNLINNLAGTGRTTETVKKNADDIAVLEVECNNLNTGVGNLNTNVLQARNEIMDIKLKLKEQTAINFLNKTGVGFYDTFEDNSNIDTTNTTATYNSTNKNVEFAGQQTLKMKDEAFDTFNNLELSLYPDKINKATIKGDVDNSTTVITGATDKTLTTGDKLFMDGILNEVLNATGNYVTNTVTDATVINYARTISGNSGRKLIRLSNGWIVAGILNTSPSPNELSIYVSKDNGSTFSLNGKISTTIINDYALACKGTQIYILETNNNTNATLYKYDILTANGQINSSLPNYFEIILDSSQTAIGNCSLAINEAETEFHAAWSSKNSTYSNSYNIRYIKGTINSGGSIVLGSVQQVTVANSASITFSSPYIMVGDNNKVSIFVVFTSGSSYNHIRVFSENITGADNTYNGTDWTAHGGSKIVYEGISYIQAYPCAIFVPQSVNGLINGRIWVAWSGKDSTDTTYHNIRVSYSDDSGTTWSTPQKLTNGNVKNEMLPSITANKNNEIFIIWYGGYTGSGQYNGIRKIKNTNGVWGDIINITDNLAANKDNPSTLIDFSINFTEPLFIYCNNETSKIGFYGTWIVDEGYTLTMQNPTILTDGQQVPIVDFEVKQEDVDLELEDIDTEKFVFKGSNLNTDNVSIKVLGKNNKVNAIAYAIA